MQTRQKDKAELDKFYEMSNGVGTAVRAQHRDASGEAGSSASPWRKAPTKIVAPRQGQVGQGSPFSADYIKSDLGNRRGRASGSARAPTLQNQRTPLGFNQVNPGYEMPSGRPPKRQKVVRDDKYQAGSRPLPRNSPHFAHGAAGKGKGYGKAAMRGGGPAKSSRVSINLNLDPPESIEIADSEEDREEKRKEERRDHSSKSAGKKRASSDNEIMEVSAPAGPWDFPDSPDDGASSDAFPTMISAPQASKTANMSYGDDEIDMIGVDDEPSAGPSTSRITASLDATEPPTTRARTRPPSQPIAKRRSTTAPEEVNVISSDEGEEEAPPPGKRMNTPNKTLVPGNVQQLAKRYNDMSSSSAPAPAPAPAPVKGRMQARIANAQWGSVPGGKLEKTEEKASTLPEKKDYSSMKFSKNKKPADGDAIATAPTPYIRSNKDASTSAPGSTSGDSKATAESASSSRTRPNPTPISVPSGSADDPEAYLPLRCCAVGFKRLPVGQGDDRAYCVALTRKLQKLLVCCCSNDNSETTVLLEVPLQTGRFEKVIACFGELSTRKNDFPFLQFKDFALTNRLSGVMKDSVDLDNGRGGNTLTLNFDPDHLMWDQRCYDKLVKHLNDGVLPKNENVQKVGAPAAKVILDDHERSCDVFAQGEKRLAVKPTDKGPRLPRAVSRTNKNKGSTVQTTLKSGMQQQLTLTQPLRRSARNSGPNNIPDRDPVPDPDEVILVYPPSGRGSVNITNGDVGRLAPGDYLNDSLIEFGLKIWLDGLRETQPDLADQIHLFSSFFYKKLGSNVETGYPSVRKWTSKINIFDKKYLIIPINENFHWYLAIVYEPGRVLQPPPLSQTRHSTRLKGDKPDINLADSQVSTAEPRPPAESGDAASISAHVGVLGSDSMPNTASGSRIAGDMSEEMEVDNALKTLAPSSSPLTEPDEATKDEAGKDDADLDLVYPASSSPSPGAADVEMKDVFHDTGPSRVASSSVETLDDPSAAGDEVDELDADVSVTSNVPANNPPLITNGPVATANFYGATPAKSAKAKGKARAEAPYLDPESDGEVSTKLADIDMTADDVQPMEEDAPTDPDAPPPTYIFTFDSLGGRHPGAGKKLGQYLHLEAHDKKGRDIASLSEWKYQVAQVPTQPNSCDCGVYLLHFAKQFMLNAEDIVTYVTTKQGRGKGKSVVLDQHWDPASVNTARDELKEIIQIESAKWRSKKEEERKEKERIEKELKEQNEKEQKGEEAEQVAPGTGDGAAAAINIDSDSEIELVDAPPVPAKKTTRAKTYGGKKNKR